MSSFVLKGTICYSLSPAELAARPDSYAVCVDGVSKGVFSSLPAQYAHLPLYDYGNALIVPGLVDLHLHAPQYTFRGTGMDLELMQWLESQAFPEEARFCDDSYAQNAYGIFARQMKHGATTRAVIFATCHRAATEKLMEQMEQSGLVSYVGLVNMDQNAPQALISQGCDGSAAQTLQWLEHTAEKFDRTKPILTPRFIPSCSRPLLETLGKLRERFDLPVQSHLSENPEEIRFVHSLFPEEPTYGHCYDRYGLMTARTVMAHCVYSDDAEIALLKDRGAFVAHCPASNANLSSGIAPIRRYLERGLNVGLGTDVAAGHSDSVFRAMTDAIQVSKLYWRLVDPNCRPLCFAEAFYLATRGGGRFFGNVGSFEDGFAFDALVLNDDDLPHWSVFTPLQRLERFAYLEQGRHSLQAKFVDGRKLF